MDRVKEYLETMFIDLPRTKEILELKAELLGNMEEKYEELTKEGSTEQEAVGIVIAEFGNIEELVEEMNLKSFSEPHSNFSGITIREVEKYLEAKSMAGFLVGLGVAILCIGVGIFISLMEVFLSERFEAIGIVFLVVAVFIGVSCFILANSKLKEFEYVNKKMSLPKSMREEIARRRDDYYSTYTIFLIIGIGLCVLSVTPIFLSEMIAPIFPKFEGLALSTMMIIAGIGVFFIVYTGNTIEGYTKLLKKN